MTLHWSAPYVGLPYRERGRAVDGVDCWGLCRMVLADCHGIAIPAYDFGHATPEERARIAALIAGEKVKAPWVAIEPGQEREFDLAVFRRGRVEQHVGIVADPRAGLLLHVNRTLGASRLEGYRSMPRLDGFYRHEALA